jgi:hypothetical protein
MVVQMMFRMTRSVVAGACAALFLVACDDATDPGPAQTQFGEPISLAEFQTEVNGTALVEIEFATAAGPVAREIEVEDEDSDDSDSDSDGEESIESRVTAINTTAGTITLQLGGLVVNYGNDTRFRTLTNSNATRADWEAFIQAELSAGRNPAIDARRPIPATPQAPTVATFTATDLQIEDDLDEPTIEVLVDADNYETVTSPPPLAILRVFNFPVQINAATRLERDVDGMPASGTVEFEARIVAVNVAGGTFTFADGTTIQVGPTTVFDPLGDVLTLAAVSTAVTAGDLVEVEGTGTVTSVGPPATIAATSVKVEIDD